MQQLCKSLAYLLIVRTYPLVFQKYRELHAALNDATLHFMKNLWELLLTMTIVACSKVVHALSDCCNSEDIGLNDSERRQMKEDRREVSHLLLDSLSRIPEWIWLCRWEYTIILNHKSNYLFYEEISRIDWFRLLGEVTDDWAHTVLSSSSVFVIISSLKL